MRRFDTTVTRTDTQRPSSYDQKVRRLSRPPCRQSASLVRPSARTTVVKPSNRPLTFAAMVWRPCRSINPRRGTETRASVRTTPVQGGRTSVAYPDGMGRTVLAPSAEKGCPTPARPSRRKPLGPRKGENPALLR